MVLVDGVPNSQDDVMGVALADIWRASAVILGLQLGGFTWRVRRELDVLEDDPAERAWIPPADFLNLIAIVVVVVGVYLWPILDLPGGAQLAEDAFGLGLVLLLGYPFALAGHYGLLRFGGRPVEGWRQPWATRSELVVIAAAALGALVFVVLATLRWK